MNSNSRHLSFNTPNSSRLNFPLAESTAIGSPLGQQMPGYGRNPKRKTVSPLANATKQRQMLQIEPHILTNAQSPGIVKRLVSYYDESQPEADKSKYVYNRVGDFPIVQLKKTEIKRNLVRSSSVRIAPPPKHIMNRDIRAAIMRSNSFQHGANVPKLVPTKMRVTDDAHQIIRHEPLPIVDVPQNSKSVLDALEKNCRKRINNEELTLDRNKRICATTAQPEVVDGPQSRDFIPIHTSAKRGREETSPPAKGDSPSSQQRKKSRLKSNALLSSLSSSQYILKRNLDVTTSSSLPTVQTITRDLPKATIATQTSTESVEKPVEVEMSLPEPKPQEKRLHLFNRKIEPSSMRKRILDDDDDEEFKINFVKPRENTGNHGNHQMRQAEQQKLSIMLSGLSDGFKSPPRDATKDAVDSVVPPQATISFSTSTTTSTVSPISTPASTNNPLLTLTSQLPSIKLPENAEKPAVTTSEASSKLPATTEAEKPMPNFQFGATTSVSTLSVNPVVTTSTAGRVSPLALFSSPGESKPATTAVIDPNKSLISFTPIAKPAVSEGIGAVASTTAPAVATTSAPAFGISGSGFTLGGSKEAPKLPGGFNFGSNTTPSSTSSATNSFLGAPAATTTAPALLPITTAAPVVVTTAPSFSFPTPTTSAFSFGAPAAAVPATTAPAMPALNSSLTGMSSFPSVGNLEKANAFIQKPQTTTASGIGFSFNAAPKTSPQVTTAAPAMGGFSFGSTVNAMAGNSAPAPAPAAAAPSTFGFGSNSGFGQPATTTTSAVFGQPSTTTASTVFGQPATTTTSSVFGQPATTTASAGFPTNPSPSFSANLNTTFTATTTSSGFAPTATSTFGSFGQKTETQPSAGMFSFGQNAAATTAPAPKADSTFSFGAPTQPAAQPLGGGFGFGQNAAAPAPAPASSSIFGRLGDKPQEPAKSAFSFGGNTQAPSIGFGTSNNTPAQPAAAPSVFGNAANNVQPSQSAPMFGQTNATSPFNSNNNNSSNSMFGSTQNSNQNGFGNTTAKPSTGMFSFGGSNNQPQQQQQQQPAQPSSGGMFNFGSNSTPSNNNVSTSSVFGGNSSQNVSASFTFKPATGTVTNNNSAPSVFGQNQNASSAAPPAYQFGNSQSATTASASFNFGGSTASSNQSSNGFNFAPQTAPVTGSAFNFQAQQPSLTPQPSSSGGLFNIGTGGNAQRRPIRQATRRMK